MPDPKTHFAPRTSVQQVEEGAVLAPKFGSTGLITCVTTATLNNLNAHSRYRFAFR